MTITDFLGRKYELEIAYVGFLHGFVAWVDDDPYERLWDERAFRTKQEAIRELKHHFGGEVTP